MGFWETAGKIAKGAANALDEKAHELQATKMRLESKSCEEIKRLIKSDGFFGSASNTEKSMAMKILRERGVKWFTEFGHLNRGDMRTSEQHRCHNEKKKFQRRV